MKNRRKNVKLKYNTVLILLLGIIFLFSIFGIRNALASEPAFKLINASIEEKSSDVNATINSFQDNTLDTDVEFHKLNDYVKIKLTIRNTTENDYKVKMVSDNNSNAYVEFSYDDYTNQTLESGNNLDVILTATYKTELTNINKRVQENEFKLSFEFIDENGNVVNEDVIVNPKTHDNLKIYVITAIISLWGLLFIIVYKYNKKNKSKYLVLLIALIPMITLAKKPSFVVTLNNFLKLFDKMVVTYPSSEGEKTVIVKYGEKMSQPEDPVKPGYNFIGWYLDDEEYDFNSNVKTDKELTPKYEIIEYTIEYDLDGGTAAGNKTKYTVETDTFDLVNPTKDGFTFAGWTGSNGDGLQTRVSIEKGSTGNKSFTANYSINQDTAYKVIHKYKKLDGTFDVEEENLTGATGSEVSPAFKSKTGFDNPASLQTITIKADGSSEVTYIYERTQYSFKINDKDNVETTFNEESYPYGTTITVTAKDKEGYTFTGWSNGYENKEYTFNISNNTELTPEYSINQYVVTFNTNEGSNVTNITKNYNEEIGELPTTTKEGHTFAGWYKESTFENKVTETTKVTSDMTLYAKWNINSYTIEFNSNGGSSVESITKDYNEEMGTLPTPTKEGHTLVGWYKESTFENKVESTTKVTNDMTLYAKWNINSYTVGFNTNGGNNIESITKDYNEALGELPTPTKDHYTFVGWYSDESLTTVVTNLTKVTGDMTLYAKWNINSYTVEFNTNGGSSVESITKNYNEEIGTLPTPTKDHYTFDGWYKESTFENKVESTTKVTSDMTLYAKWTVDKYTVTFDAVGGTPVESIEVEYNTEIGTLPTTTKNGYILEGWYTSLVNGDKITSETIITDDVTYHAHWTLATYICKKATTLHTATCESTGGCASAGYTATGAKKTTTITYGNIPSSTLTVGDAYDCDVNGDGVYNATTERFYYIGSNDDNAKFIYSSGFEGEDGPKNSTIFKYDLALTKLPTTEQWSNLPVTFENDKAARFLTKEELTASCSNNGNITNTGALDNCVFLLETSRFESSSTGRTAIWLELNGTTYNRIHTKNRNYATVTNSSENAVRPVIEVPLNKVDDSLLVKYNATGGTVDPDAKKVEPGDEIGELPTPTRDKYIFDGWYTQENGGTKISSTYKVEDDVEVYARWKKSVSFIELESDEISTVTGQTTTINITNSSEIGEDYTFASNATSVATVDNNGVVTGVSAGNTTIDITGNDSNNKITINVIVSTTARNLTISFNTNGGSSVEDMEVLENEPIGELPTPTKDDHTFVGWYSNSTLTTKVTKTTKFTSDATLYAKWMPNDAVAEVNGTYYTTLQAAFNAVPATKTETEIIIVKDTNVSSVISIPNSKIVKLNIQNFTITNTSSDASVFQNSGILKITSGKITSVASSGMINNNSGGQLIITGGTLEATGTRQVVYNNAGTLKISKDAIIKSSSSERAAVHNLNNGTVEITGGTITSTGQNAIENASGSLTIGTKDGTVDSTSPIIQGKKYGVLATQTFKFYDGTIKGIDKAISDDTKISEMEVGSTLESDTDGDFKTAFLNPTKDYVITLNPKGGTVTPSTLLIGIGSSLGTLPTPERSNYDFNGWYTEEDGGTEVDENTVPEGNTTYFASWNYRASDEVVNFNTTNDAMKVYFNNIASWKEDTDTFQSNMNTNFNNYNCSECTGPNYQSCPTPASGKMLCDQPKGYDTGVTESEIKVYESNEVTKTKGDEVTYATITNGTIYNLIPGETYYWEATGNSSIHGYVKINAERRTISSNVRNVRDLGGLEVDTDGDGTADGTLKYGRIYRGAKLNDSPTDTAELEKLGITEEVDLRGSSEGASDPRLTNYVPREIKNYLIYHDVAAHASDYAKFRQAVYDTMQDVIDGENIYFHCKIGTDRTGTMAYFLEGLLGVSLEDKLEDYELSYFYGLLNRNRLHDNLSGSSINPRFKSMYEHYNTNEKIYEWFMAAATTEEEQEQSRQLIEDFREAMIESY